MARQKKPVKKATAKVDTKAKPLTRRNSPSPSNSQHQRKSQGKTQVTKVSPKSHTSRNATPNSGKAKHNKFKKQPLPASSSEDEDDVNQSNEEEEVEEEKNVPSNRKGVRGAGRKNEVAASDEEDSEESDDKEDENDKKETGYTDDNAKWLKPKQKEPVKKSQLLSSDDEDDDDDVPEDDEFIKDKGEEHDKEKDDDDDEEDDEDEDEEMEVERQSRRLDEELLVQQEEAEQELRRTIAEHTEIFHLPSKEELEKDAADRVVPPSEIKARVESILEVLADFKNRREEGRSRSEYVEQLIIDIAEVFGYLPELVEYFYSMFGPSETLEFVDASDKPRPLVIRTNTLKARRKDLAANLMKRGVTLDPLAAWSKVGLKIIESTVPIGATPEYLSGMYMLQSAASMCPVMALSPQLKEKVLDMSAAPGGKTSYIAQLMRNTGVIFANDLKPERQKATVANLHRLGVKNVIACALDGRKLGTMFRNRFDRILLDAPCSGLGVISRDPSVKIQRTMADVQRCAHLQKELLLAAIDALNHKSKTGGVMVYSTCSVSVAENEEVINYALSKRDIKIVDAGLDFGKPGFTRYQQRRFHPSVALTRRFYPHVHNMDGFFVAKIQKLSDKHLDEVVEEPTNQDENSEEMEVEQVAEKDDAESSNDDDEDDASPKRGLGKRRVSKGKKGKVTAANVKKPRIDGKRGKVVTDTKKPRHEGGSATKRPHQPSNSPSAAKSSFNKGGSKKPQVQSNVSSTKSSQPKVLPKKKKQNAKVTKPRRSKSSSAMM